MVLKVNNIIEVETYKNFMQNIKLKYSILFQYAVEAVNVSKLYILGMMFRTEDVVYTYCVA